MKNNTNEDLFRKIFIIILAVTGVLITIKLANVYYEANFNPYALPSFCSINQFIDCDGIAQTTHSQFVGIPLAYWGMFLYIFIIFMAIVDKLKQVKLLRFLEVFKNPLMYIASLGFISFAISMILAGISVFEIHKVCLLCLVTYFLNLLIAVIATDFTEGILKTFKTSFTDFVDALKIKKYMVTFLILSSMAGCVLLYTTLSNCFTPQVKRYREFKHYEKLRQNNPFTVSGNVLGDKDAKITAYIYTDYQCPICQTYNVIVHRAAQELAGVKFVHKNLPLDMACNSYLKEPFHENACMLAKYAISAENQGRFWEFNSEIFEKQPKNEDAVIKLAAEMGFNINKLKSDAYSNATSLELKKDIDSSVGLHIDGTPTIVLNGKVYSGIKPYYELKRILMEAGAVERKSN